ncbi:hypothetical protein EDB81DRAFT_838026 [Dactylonectria macrodidyma]|uniref:Kelch repeat-containing protein n=1 Tax=Dactylonectria macrodidyma TaxID=307937 RepID=A0A9P9FMM1_9HYPO|nr:hypothetical protein EDB81DRAFT_838026 [Dactylonectria macrodidyma]
MCSLTAGERWESLAPFSDGARQEHGAAAIGQKIYIISGFKLGGNTSDTAYTTETIQIYDIDTNTWSGAAPMPVPMNHPNVAATSGKIYVLSGLRGESNNSLNGSSIVSVYGDEIILAGGVQKIEYKVNGAEETVNIVSAFNIRTHEWRSYPQLPEGREHAGGAIMSDKFYVVGGRYLSPLNVRGTVYVLSLKSLQWDELAPMPTPRGGISVAAVGERIYTFGGEGNPDPNAGDVFNQTEVYDVQANCWQQLKPMDIPRHGTAAVAVGGIIYTPGGGAKDGITSCPAKALKQAY